MADAINWRDPRSGCDAWDRITNYAPTGEEWTDDDVRAQAQVWADNGEPCEPEMIEAAIRYYHRCRGEE